MSPPFVKLAGTWPSVTTWRGLTAMIAEGLYVLWVVSAPLVTLLTFLKLGVALVAMMMLRSILLRTALRDPAPDIGGSETEARRSRYQPLAYYCHRNHTLHAMACLAAIGTDWHGALVLLIVGAMVDWSRKSTIRQQSTEQISSGCAELNHEAPFRFGIESSLIQLVIAMAVSFSILTWLWAIPTRGNQLIAPFDLIARFMGHFQRSIINISLSLERGFAFDDAIRFRITLALYISILFFFVVGRHNSIMRFYLSAKGVMISVRNPLLSSLLNLPAASFLYFAVSFYGPSEQYPGPMARTPNYSFSRVGAVILLANVAAVAFILQSHLGTLTQLRASMPNHLNEYS